MIHPVVGMGKIISLLERGGIDRRPRTQLIYGGAMVLLALGLFAVPVYFVLLYLKSLGFIVYVIIGAVLLKPAFSWRELRRAALRIKGLLLQDRLDQARFELRSLVSRDTRALSQPLLVSATVESVAENTCDSLVAPLFYFLVFGVPGAVAYRVVNTFDAMIGYHGRYEYLGKFAARLDDILNFIPARLTALLLVFASFISLRSVANAWRVMLSCHARTESPNAGWPMAAVAGALNVELEKVGHYRLGKATTSLVPETIDGALKLALIASLFWVAICLSAGAVRFAITT